MFYHLLYPLSNSFKFLNVFKYITSRSFFAFLIAAIISVIWGHYFIDFMKMKQFGQIIREDGPESHFKKRNTDNGWDFHAGEYLYYNASLR